MVCSLVRWCCNEIPFPWQNASMVWWHELGVPKSKLVMGAATYGRTFRMASSSQWQVGDPSSGAGDVGPYSATAGFLAYYEVSLWHQLRPADAFRTGNNVREHGNFLS